MQNLLRVLRRRDRAWMVSRTVVHQSPVLVCNRCGRAHLAALRPTSYKHIATLNYPGEATEQRCVGA
eukprot:5373223-Pyramimonas_sp.AAC.1